MNTSKDKLREIILQCLKFGTGEDGKIPKTKLAKLVYLSDFTHFYNTLEPMSGVKYKKLQYGPVSDEFLELIEEMQSCDEIFVESKGNALLCSRIEDSETEILTIEEISLIQKISEKWRNQSTKKIVDFTHNQLPWKIVQDQAIVPYELITQEEENNVF